MSPKWISTAHIKIHATLTHTSSFPWNPNKINIQKQQKHFPLKFVQKNQKLTGKKFFRYLTEKVLHYYYYYYSGISWYQSQTVQNFINRQNYPITLIFSLFLSEKQIENLLLIIPRASKASHLGDLRAKRGRHRVCRRHHALLQCSRITIPWVGVVLLRTQWESESRIGRLSI